MPRMEKRRTPLFELSQSELGERLDVSANELDEAADRLRELHGGVADPVERQRILLAATEVAGQSMLGARLAARVIEMGPVERIAEVSTIRGIGPSRLRLLARSLAATDLGMMSREPVGPALLVDDPVEAPDVSDRFLRQVAGLLDEVEADLVSRAARQRRPDAQIQATLGLFDGAHRQVRQVQDAVASERRVARVIAQVVDETNALAINDAILADPLSTPAGLPGEGMAEALRLGLLLARTVLDLAGRPWRSGADLTAMFDDLARLLALLGELR